MERRIGYHTIGCGDLNRSNCCDCGPGWTPEAIRREAKKISPNNKRSLSLAEALKNHDATASEAKQSK